jgi:hypothetical protein
VAVQVARAGVLKIRLLMISAREMDASFFMGLDLWVSGE